MDANIKSDINSAIGKVFKTYRQKNHLTQEQIAEKLGISDKYISRLENGRGGVKTETLINSMNILGITPNVMFENLITNSDVILQINLSYKISELSTEKLNFLDSFIDNLKNL